jgi:hypothetical protein
MKKNIMIAVSVIAAVFLAALVKDAVIKSAVEQGAAIVTGLKLKIGGLNVGVLRPVVDIRNIRLLNPAGFPDRTMVDMPVVYVKYDLPAIIGGTIHLPEAKLSLKEFVVVKNSKGELNLNALRTVKAHKEGRAPAQETPAKAPKIKIDKLTLNIGRAVYKDYSKGGAPLIKEFDVNINETYTDVEDPYALASLIVVKSLMNTSIASLTNFDLKGLQGTVGDTLATAQKAATEAAKKAQDTVKEAADTMKDLFKNPFASSE